MRGGMRVGDKVRGWKERMTLSEGWKERMR